MDIAELTGETETEARPGLVIAEVTECAPHPMAEKLTICTIDYGGEVGRCRLTLSDPHGKRLKLSA